MRRARAMAKALMLMATTMPVSTIACGTGSGKACESLTGDADQQQKDT
jgi:hypothetical protein